MLLHFLLIHFLYLRKLYGRGLQGNHNKSLTEACKNMTGNVVNLNNPHKEINKQFLECIKRKIKPFPPVLKIALYHRHYFYFVANKI